jgi:AmiR/NasT family two-component response regulator
MENYRNIRVLIAEDDYLVGVMIKGLLEQIGYKVVGEATNGREAVEMTKSLQPTVVLMDVRMPDMDGIEATQHIYKECPTPVVVLTAYESSKLVEQATQAGAGAYLTKPLNLQEVTRAISISIARFEDMMAVRRLNKELEIKNEELKIKNKQLQDALDKIDTLSGLLPICASCKKIRDDKGLWHEIEEYIRQHANVDFSHSLCPDCLERLYPDFIDSKE